VKKWFLYWFHSVNKDAMDLHQYFHRASSKTNEMTMTAFLGALAAIFQSAGGFIPGVGYLISPIATAPIILGAIYSIRSGLMAYLLGIALLVIIQPSEIIIFPFTTGLLGLGIGIGFVYLKKRITIVALASFLLVAGIAILLYGFRFPLLGPVIGSAIPIIHMVYIYLFSFIYCWLWVEISLICLKKLRIMLDI
jgi:hypothetical protein